MALYTWPDEALDAAALHCRPAELQESDWDTRGLRLPLHCYFSSDSQQAFSQIVSVNALAPPAFPSSQHMERDVVAVTLNLLNGGSRSAASITSGGTESINLALKAARDIAVAKRSSVRPGVVTPDSAPPPSITLRNARPDCDA